MPTYSVWCVALSLTTAIVLLLRENIKNKTPIKYQTFCCLFSLLQSVSGAIEIWGKWVVDTECLK